jgi:hypothetical protein
MTALVEQPQRAERIERPADHILGRGKQRGAGLIRVDPLAAGRRVGAKREAAYLVVIGV